MLTLENIPWSLVELELFEAKALKLVGSFHEVEC
jgi:hypothetical protein